MQKTRGVVLIGAAAVLVVAAALPRTEAMLWMVGALLAGGVLIAALVEPAFALAVALIAGPFQPFERVMLQLPIDSGQLLLSLALFSYLLRWLAQRRLHEPLRWRVGAPFVAGAGFLVVGLASFFPARDLVDWLFECIKLVQLLIIGLLAANERDLRRRALIVGALFVSAFGQSLLGVVQHHLLGSGPKEFLLPGTDRYRAYGTFEQPNPYGGYLGLIWPVAFGMALHLWHARQRVWSVAAFVVAGAAAYGVYISGSRGALIGVGLAVAAMAAALLRRPGRWLVALVSAVVIAFAAGVIDVPASLESQLAEYGDIDVRDAYLTPINFSTIERLAHWQAAVRMAEAHPWLGVGLGNYGAAYDDYRLIVWGNALGHAHNYYLNLLAETGLLGFVAYLGWWGTAAAWLWRTRRESDPSKDPKSVRVNFLAVGLLGALGHLFGHSAFDNLYVANSHLVLGVLLGMVVATTADGRRTTDDSRRRTTDDGRQRAVVRRLSSVVFLLCSLFPRTAAHAQGSQPLQSPITTPAVGATAPVTVPLQSPIAYTAPISVEIGRTVRGRPILAYRFGDGPNAKMLVGGIHGGYEFNTVELMSRTLTYLATTPQEIPADVTLFVVPMLNPDGYAAGTDRLRGRLNGAGVDLNRNWEHEWQPTAWHGMNQVSGGTAPFSEPETRAMRDFIREQHIGAVVFYHSQMGTVFHGAGVTQTHTTHLAQTVARATGYVFLPDGVPGQIMTGNAIDYLTKYEGVDAIEIELFTRYDIEWARNLAGIRAFLKWEPPPPAPSPPVPPAPSPPPVGDGAEG